MLWRYYIKHKNITKEIYNFRIKNFNEDKTNQIELFYYFQVYGIDEDIEFQIDGEFVVNGYEENVLSHEEGVLTMIRYDYTQQIPTLTTESYNSGNAQLGIMINNGRSLNGLYAGFGKIINGMDIVKKIVADTQIVEVPEEEKTGIDEFSTKPVIKSVTVDTFGKNYGVPYYEEFFDFEDNSSLELIL